MINFDMAAILNLACMCSFIYMLKNIYFFSIYGFKNSVCDNGMWWK